MGSMLGKRCICLILAVDPFVAYFSNVFAVIYKSFLYGNELKKQLKTSTGAVEI